MAEDKEKNVEPDTYGKIFEACRKMPCILKGVEGHTCYGYITGHHIKRVGAGGTDYCNTIPVCVRLHDLLHGKIWGITERDICVKFNIDLYALAADITKRVIDSDGLSSVDMP